jgi:GTP pyrophosphokinase
MVTIDDLLKKLNSEEDKEQVKKAYEFAEKVHKGMKRLTKDDYITHPLEVANIVMDLNVDVTTIVSALLHETINNGNVTKEELEEEFGEEVAKIVESVSRINKLELPDDSESSKIYLRKILVGMSEDVRVLYIKLADRLHNMRTNWAVNPVKQKQKARETMDILIPIAHRLGINSIKSELENLCLFYLKPDVYNDILEKLNSSVLELNDSLNDMKTSLIDLMNENDIKFEIKGRVKSVYSIYNKLNNGKKWNDIYDILALRIYVEKVSDCYAAIGLIHSKFKPVPKRFKDYIAQPKENMYQSLHTTVYGVDGKIFEIQVRTYEMDEIAEKGIASHWSYKEKGTKKIQNAMEQKLEIYRNIIDSNKDKEDVNYEEEIISDMIYVYTPKGDVMELPKGSTPIDFAYRIHTNVGNTAVGAIVNDLIVPFSYELQDGDVVKIKTNASSAPNKDWLNIVKTTQAISKIKSYFSKKDHEEYVNKGKDYLEKELRKRHLAFADVFNTDSINKVINELKFKDEEDLYLSIGSFRYTAGFIINLATEDNKDAVDPFIDKKKENTKKIDHKGAILVDGIDNILVNIAKCCKPIKGDPIVGYITKTSGISIHKANCINMQEITERKVDVTWNDASDNFYLTNLYVHVNKEENILSDIIEIVSKQNIYVPSFNTIDMNNKTIYEIVVRVKNVDDLQNVINAISRLAHVKEVTREFK